MTLLGLIGIVAVVVGLLLCFGADESPDISGQIIGGIVPLLFYGTLTAILIGLFVLASKVHL